MVGEWERRFARVLLEMAEGLLHIFKLHTTWLFIIPAVLPLI